jgi:hypothetical protein
VSVLYIRAKSLNHRLLLSEKLELKTCNSLIYCGLGLDVNEAPLLALGGSAGYSIKMSYKNLLKSYIFSENVKLHFCSLAKIYKSLSIHSFSSLSDDRSNASSKTVPPHSAI